MRTSILSYLFVPKTFEMEVSVKKINERNQVDANAMPMIHGLLCNLVHGV